MYPTEVSINQKNIDRLTSVLKRAYSEIIDEMKTATSFGVANRRIILAQIRKTLERAGVEVKEVIDDEIPYQYEKGMTDATRQLKDNDVPINTKTAFNKIHTEAIAALVDDTSRAFGESLTGVNRSARLLLNRAVRDEITQRLAIDKIGGRDLKAIKRNVVGLLEEQGLSALVDKAGHTWELDRYSEMLIRTKSVEARNRGLANRMVENGYDLVQVSNHNSAHRECAIWEGKILSLTGKTPGYSTIAKAEAEGLFHPNCKHAINVIVPELAEKTQAYVS